MVTQTTIGDTVVTDTTCLEVGIVVTVTADSGTDAFALQMYLVDAVQQAMTNYPNILERRATDGQDAYGRRIANPATATAARPRPGGA
jgi:hypothetical protein